MKKLIPFKRRSVKEVPFMKYTFYNTTTKKKRNSWLLQLPTSSRKVGFEWVDVELEFLYTMKMSTDKKKLIRKMTMGKKSKKITFTR